MMYRVSAMIPVNKTEVYEIEAEQKDLPDIVKQLAKQHRWTLIICQYDTGYKVYRYDGTGPLFYDHTIKRWISKQECYERKQNK